jgi:hypothetical protein
MEHVNFVDNTNDAQLDNDIPAYNLHNTIEFERF